MAPGTGHAAGARPSGPIPRRGAAMPPGRLVLAAALALTLVGGCGLGLRADEQPQPIPRDRLDDLLFEEGGEASVGSRWARIFVLSTEERTQQLVSVDVPVPGGERYERAVLETLLRWTPPKDRGTNVRLSSLIPYGTRLRDVRRDGEVVTVDLSNLTIEGPGQAPALAQIVYTATEIPGIEYVRFMIDGKDVAVPLGDTSAEPGSRLRREDFRELGLSRTTTTTAPAAPAPEPAAVVPEPTPVPSAVAGAAAAPATRTTVPAPGAAGTAAIPPAAEATPDPTTGDLELLGLRR